MALWNNSCHSTIPLYIFHLCIVVTLFNNSSYISSSCHIFNIRVSMAPTFCYDCGLVVSISSPSGRVPGRTCTATFTTTLNNRCFVLSNGNILSAMPMAGFFYHCCITFDPITVCSSNSGRTSMPFSTSSYCCNCGCSGNCSGNPTACARVISSSAT